MLDTLNKLAEHTTRYRDMKGKELGDWVALIRQHRSLFVSGIKKAFESWGGDINKVGFWWPDGHSMINEDEVPPENVVSHPCEEEGCVCLWLSLLRV